MGGEPCPRSRAVESVTQPNELVLDERIEGVHNEGPDGGWPRLVLALRVSRFPATVLRHLRIVIPPVPARVAGIGRRPDGGVRGFADKRGGDRQKETLRLPRTGAGRDDDVPAMDIGLLERFLLMGERLPCRSEQALADEVGNVLDLWRGMSPREQRLANLLEGLRRPAVRWDGLDEGMTDNAPVAKQQIPPLLREVAVAQGEGAVEVSQIDVVQILREHERVAHREASWPRSRAAMRATSGGIDEYVSVAGCVAVCGGSNEGSLPVQRIRARSTRRGGRQLAGIESWRAGRS